MSDTFILTAAVAATIVSLSAVAALLWRVARYAVRTHDELLGSGQDRPSVRTLTENLNRDLRKHMVDESSTIWTLESKIAAIGRRIDDVVDQLQRLGRKGE